MCVCVCVCVYTATHTGTVIEYIQMLDLLSLF